MDRLCILAEDDDPEALPPTGMALEDPNGLLAAGGSLRPEWLLAAYRRGIFPWFASGQPILWWSPDPRTLLVPREFRCSRSLAKRLRRGDFELRLDCDFAAVVRACATVPRRESGTWITRSMSAAYQALHELGHAHSVESWQDGELVGGLYGICLGAVFFGESMFSRRSDASKTALAGLVELCLASHIELIDCQMQNPHLASLGSRMVPRRAFEGMLDRWCREEGSRWPAGNSIAISGRVVQNPRG